ncbi:Putative developmental regulatory protein WetA [Septoria linicola]|uniref:Developmental regulatory protein WetA n=1 Tax=Septoria linicola TaxID=215465 RepID=A0A9Q9AQF5_9PEZI|nr:putative developmental regulatory protein WetA [Septoria linicola]USW53827.1 Putative developmental regulatory protein WetA [Septoria linicola]
MALTSRKSMVHMRSMDKEFDWNSIRDNVLEEYLGDDPFGFSEQRRERSSSDDSCQLFDFSGSSEQSAQTGATSPIPAWEVEETRIPEARQPKAKVPTDFWHRKLRALEQNAADCERRQKLRAAKSHPDFLSLGGFPSPPAIPSSPTVQSYSVQRQKSRAIGNAANGKKTPTQQRSVSNLRAVSRGRPVGVTKPPATAAAATATPGATVRQRNGSPSKMMNPSRYRAGFKDVWAERMLQSPKKFQLRVDQHVNTFPASPPHSARSVQDSFAAFGSPTYSAIAGSDEEISPLASTFRQAARIHTPLASPLLSPGSHAAPSYFELAPPPLPGNPYSAQTVPLNDTAPLYPERGSSLAANKIQEFDFGFDSPPALDDPWSTTSAPFAEPPLAMYTTTAPVFDNQDPFASLENSLENNLIINAHSQNSNLGLGISPCDSNGNYTTIPGNALHYATLPPSISPYYVPSLPNGLPSIPTRPPNGLPSGTQQPINDLPITPCRQRGSQDRSRSPSHPATESRTRQSSTSRLRSQHRRTKSASTTPRHDKGGGFVNFTPGDAGKILSGVAPSGSSKTKARREKEAADKRRKLSQAAMQAVIEAGGDVESLQRAGLIA